MLGLTPIGVAHTLAGLIALVLGAREIIRHREIAPNSRGGQVYLVLTLFAALTSFAIFRRGGFGPGHVLAVLTVLAIVVGLLARRGRGWWRYLATFSLSSTLLFHLVPGATETLLRFPIGAPLAATPSAPILRPVLLTLLVLFLIGAAAQAWWLSRASGPSEAP